MKRLEKNCEGMEKREGKKKGTERKRAGGGSHQRGDTEAAIIPQLGSENSFYSAKVGRPAVVKQGEDDDGE